MPKILCTLQTQGELEKEGERKMRYYLGTPEVWNMARLKGGNEDATCFCQISSNSSFLTSFDLVLGAALCFSLHITRRYGVETRIQSRDLSLMQLSFWLLFT